MKFLMSEFSGSGKSGGTWCDPQHFREAGNFGRGGS